LVSGLNFSHGQNIPVYLSQWNKIAIERATVEGGTYAAISGSPVAIEWDNSEGFTLILDSAGASTNYYRWRLYNSVTGTYSAYSDELPAAGLSRKSVGFAIKMLRRIPEMKTVSDEVLMDFFYDFDESVYEKIPTAWFWTREGTEVSTVTSTYRYGIDTNWSDYVAMNTMLYHYVSGSVENTSPLKYITPVEFYNLKADSNQSTSDTVTGYSILPPDGSDAKGYIGLHPTPKTTTCFLKPVYEREPFLYNSFADVLLLPKIKGYLDYATYRFYDEIVRDTNKSDIFNSRASREIEGLQKRARKQFGEMVFTRYRGQRGVPRGRTGTSDDMRENYW